MIYHHAIWPALLGAVLATLCSWPVRAGDPDASPTGVLLVPVASCASTDRWTAVEKRIVQELSLCDVTLTVTAPRCPADTAPQQTLVDVLRQSNADGAILVTVQPETGVFLYGAFRSPGKTALEHTQHYLVSVPAPDAIEVAAIKTREAVLAALYARTTSPTSSSAPSKNPPAKKPSVTASKKSPPVMKRSKHRLSIAGLFGPVWAPGGVGALGCVSGAATVYPSHRISVGIRGDISILSKDIETDAATASVNLFFGRLQAAYLFSGLGQVFPKVGIQAGVGQFQSEGKSDVLPVRRTRATFFLGGLFGEVAFVLNKRIHIPIMLGVCALPRRIDVRVARKTEAEFKLLLLEAGIGVSVML